MNERKSVFIIPGFRHKPTHKPYRMVAKLLKKEGYVPFLMKIPWKQTTISENTEYFLKEYKKIRRKKKYILGFSFGAMIALVASTKVRVAGLILCSLSPYFKEDLIKNKKNWMDKYSHDFLRLSARTLARKVKTNQILMLYGAKEAKSLIARVKETFKHIESNEKHLFPVKKADHNIGDTRYLGTIHQITKTLQ